MSPRRLKVWLGKELREVAPVTALLAFANIIVFVGSSLTAGHRHTEALLLGVVFALATPILLAAIMQLLMVFIVWARFHGTAIGTQLPDLTLLAWIKSQAMAVVLSLGGVLWYAPIAGYLLLMSRLLGPRAQDFARAWNLGPQDPRQYSVREVLELMCSEWRRPPLEFMSNPLPEAGALALDSSLARNLLGWEPAWDTHRVIRETAAWYRKYYEAPETARALTLAQIDAWRKDIGA